MCWPALIPIAIGAVGGMMQGQQAKDQASAQASALRRNAVFLGNAAADARVRGMQESDWSRVETGQLIGTQRSAMAASGGIVDQDSNALIQQDTAQLGELDALTISNNAAREAYGYEVERTDALLTAATLKSQANKAMTSSILGGALSGVGSAFGGMGGGGGGASSGGLGLGTRSALQGSTRLSANQAYV